MTRERLVRLALVNVGAPLVALLVAFGVSSVALVLSGNDPLTAFTSMFEYGTRFPSIIDIVNRAGPLYISGVAVAIGFKMGLFNIGVEGQYRIATLLAAAAGAALMLPGVLHLLFVMTVAMLVGGAWAGIAGVLKAYRGVHEVISTIMLNFIATGVGAYLLAEVFVADRRALIVATRELPPTAGLPTLNPLLEAVGFEIRGGADLHSYVVVALLAGVAYHVIISHSRFGYDLRASGVNAEAAEASGVDATRMIVHAMVLSGVFAGLVGLLDLLSVTPYRYSIGFPSGLGFAGIAVALLGRNHPVGIYLAALLFGFLDRSAQILDLTGIPKEVVQIIQGSVVLSVVVAYEVAFRIARARETKAAADATGSTASGEVVP